MENFTEIFGEDLANLEDLGQLGGFPGGHGQPDMDPNQVQRQVFIVSKNCRNISQNFPVIKILVTILLPSLYSFTLLGVMLYLFVLVTENGTMF